MKVNIFITKYNARVKHVVNLTTEIIMNTITDLIKPVDYISFQEKVDLVEKTIDETKHYKYPSVYRLRQFIVNLICAYTSLECTIDDFDLLSKSKLLDVIISTFESEYRICNTIMQICLDDDKGG